MADAASTGRVGGSLQRIGGVNTPYAMLHKSPRVKCCIWRVDTTGHLGVVMANGTGHPTSTAGGAGRSGDALQCAVYALNNQNRSEAQRIAGDILKAEPRHA